MYSVKEKFYIPLVELTVDVDKLKQEVYKYVQPNNGDYALTCLESDQDSETFDFKQYAGQRVYTPVSKYLLSTGQMDYDLVYWPKMLNNSYIKEVGIMIADYLRLKAPRCRLSVTNTDEPTSIGYHVDNHTPYRVHVVLETTPESIWKFREGPEAVEYTMHQPISQHPALIETGTLEHDIYVPPKHKRMHLWYQFHDTPKQSQIDALIDKARS